MAWKEVPFAGGLDESFDTKLAPTGVLKQAENVRWRKRNRLGKRFGVNTHDHPIGDGLLSGDPIVGIYSLGNQRLLHARAAVGSDQSQKLLHHVSQRGGWELVPGSPPSVNAPIRTVVDDGRSATVEPASPCVVTLNGYTIVAFADNDGEDIIARCYNEATGAVVWEQVFNSPSGGVGRMRMFPVGNYACLVYGDTTGSTDITFRRVDTSSASASGFTGTATLASGADFDEWAVSPFSSTQFLFVRNTTATNWRVELFSDAGVASGTLVDVTVSADDKTPDVIGTPSERIYLAWRNANGANPEIVRLRSWNTSFGSALGPTDVFTASSNNSDPRPVLGRVNATNVVVAWGYSGSAVAGASTQATQWKFVTSAHSVGGLFAVGGCSPASRPYSRGGSDFDAFMWVVTQDAASDTMYALVRLAGGEPQAFAARKLARESMFLNAGFSVADVASSGDSYLFAGLLVTQGLPSFDPLVGVGLWRYDHNNNDRCQVVESAGCLYATGGFNWLYDGARVMEIGFSQAPYIRVNAGYAAGAVTRGFYATFDQVDAQYQRHRSPLSNLVTITDVTLANPPRFLFVAPELSLRSRAASQFAAKIMFWSNDEGGATFQLAADDDDATYSPVIQAAPITGSTNMTLTTQQVFDPPPDAEILYTQGERGPVGGGGLLEHEAPPPARFIARGRTRLCLAHTEEGSGYAHFSKLLIPEEPAQWTSHNAFKIRVPGAITGGVAEMDDAWHFFTSDGIYRVTGEGPDDRGQNGLFDEPQQLPSDIGSTDARALLLLPQGLVFQGTDGQLHILPRGGGVPEWFGEPIQDVLASFPVVTSALLIPEQGIALWTVTDTGGTAGRVLVYDTDHETWSADKVAGGAAYVSSALWSGKPAYAEAVVETDAIDHEGTTFADRTSTYIPITLETQALRPGGMDRHNRVRKIRLLGERVGDAQVQIDYAVGDSASYVTTTPWTVTDAGVMRRELRPREQKSDSFRIRVRELQDGAKLNEGLIFNGLSFEVATRPGPSRERTAYRR